MNTLYGIAVVLALVLWTYIAVMFIAWGIQGLRKPRQYNACVCVLTKDVRVFTVYECEGVDEAEAILDLGSKVAREYGPEPLTLKVFDLYEDKEEG